MTQSASPREAAESQNSESHIRLLAAASQTYSLAKRVLALQIALTVFGSLGFAIAAIQVLRWGVWAALYSFVTALVDALVLEKIQSDLRCQGAQIQEQFDCAVLRLAWRWALVGDPPPTELIVERAATYIQERGDDKLRDWYPPVAFQLPMPLARLICQRANAWWDARLRGRYRTALVTLVCLPAIPAIAAAIRSGVTIEKFVLGFLAPVTPAVIWGVREASKQRTAENERLRLRSHIEAQWDSAIQGRLKGPELDETSAEIQDQTFVLRRNSPLIFNWIHDAFRDKQQKTMTQIAEDLVAQATAVGIGNNA